MSETVRMGFEGRVFYGPAGAEGTTLIEEERDTTEQIETEKANTTAKGDHSGPVIQTEDVTVLSYQLEISILNNTDDPALEAFKAAVAAGTALAIRTKDHAAGKGFDGDMTFSKSAPWPLNGEQVITFTGTPTRKHGRIPQLYV